METSGGGKHDLVTATLAMPVGRKRYVTALLCLWVTTICYADRTCRVVSLSLGLKQWRLLSCVQCLVHVCMHANAMVVSTD